MDRIAPDGSVVEGRAARPDLIVFEIRHDVTAPDLEWMARLLEESLDRAGPVDLLLIARRLDEPADGGHVDAELPRLSFGSPRRLGRCAMVGAPLPEWAKVAWFDAFRPINARSFERAEEAEAWVWVGTGGEPTVNGMRANRAS